MSEPRSESDVGAPRAEASAVEHAVAPGPLPAGGLLTSPLASLEHDLTAERSSLEAELDEIGMLVNQARVEALRHEEKRTAAATRLDAARRPGNEAEALETAAQLATLTRRAAVMQAQVDVLEGKLKVLGRYRDSLAAASARIASLGREGASLAGTGMGGAEHGAGVPGSAASPADVADAMPPATSRIVLAAQEELRREIARTMHDGPAQSLTNIVLQAQIVDRLVGRDPERAAAEMRQLVSMVQQTLDATKSFIFDVRPMVLDDLGLVPTIRRTVRERGRRAQIPVEFESFGSDRRLPMELESGLFRILDEALAAYLEARPDRVVIRLDWSDGVEARIHAMYPNTDNGSTVAPEPAGPGPETGPEPDIDRGRMGRLRRGRSPVEEAEAMPAALAEMIESNQRAANRAAGLSPAAWREIQQRAGPLGLHVELLDDGRELRLSTADARESATT